MRSDMAMSQREYAHLDDAAWQWHLQAFLRGLRSRAPIFRSGATYEAAALANIDRELATVAALAASRSGHADRRRHHPQPGEKGTRS